MVKRRESLRLTYHLSMLLNEKSRFTVEEYKNRTSCDEVDEENSKKLNNNMKIFNSYAESGIEFLKNKFEHCQNITEVVDELYQYVDDFAIEVGLKESNLELSDFN